MQDTITLSDGTIVQVADFEFGFTFDAKALDVSDGDGPLIIEGYASDFDIDRQDEAFEPGAFDAGIKSYMENPVILYHHKMDQPMGKTHEMRLDQKGLWVRAEIDRPEPGTNAADIFNKVKSRTIKGFSVGGKFFRRMTDNGMRIFKCDLREISLTPMPVNQRMLFQVAGKAFENMDTTEPEAELTEIMERLDKIDKVFQAHEGKASQHPDGPAIAALQYHLQAIHTLAINTSAHGEADETKQASASIADHAKADLKSVHKVAGKIGPLPNTYAGTSL